MIEGKEKTVIEVLYQETIRPGEQMPLPDDKNPDINSRMKIAIKPEGCKSWSEEFKISAIKTKLQPD